MRKKAPKQKKNQSAIRIMLLFLTAFVLELLIIGKSIQDSLPLYDLENIPVVQKEIQPYPYLREQRVPKLSAHGALILEKDSMVVLYAKNQHLVLPTASTAKIMTALTALEYFSSNDVIMAKDLKNTEGSTVGFRENEEFRFLDVLYGMLLPSGNDAATIIAQQYPGGNSAFVKKMNENVLKYGLFSTHFSDATGLNDTADFASPIDLARLSVIALQNNTFAQIVKTKTHIIRPINVDNSYVLQNLNKLLDQEGVIGVKTGFTKDAGGVLVTSLIENGHTYIFVVMKSEDRFADTQELISLIRNNVEFENFN